MSVFLIGYRGCGKTTVGKRLADRLWHKFVDSDDLIVKQAGMSIKDIFEQEGEEFFRDREAGVLLDLVPLDDHVIAMGGGVIVREDNRNVLKQSGHSIIYMKCDPKELYRRIKADPNTPAMRPGLTELGGSLEEITKLMTVREPIYRSIMTAELDVTHLNPQDACTYIARLL